MHYNFLGVAIGMSSGLAQTVFSNSILLGDCFMIATIIQGAIFSVFSRSYFHKYASWLVTVISISVGFLGLSLFFLGLFEVSSLRTLSGSEIIYLLVLGTVGVPVQFGLFACSISHLGPSRAIMYIALTPFSATVLAVVILNETVTTALIVGLLFVIKAIFLANWKEEQN